MEDRAYEKARHDAAIERANSLGRWPANVAHDGSDEVVEAFPDAPGQFAAVKGTDPSPAMGTNGIFTIT
jgi:hypothetical protein